MSDCLFCAIASGDIPATVVRESADVVVFRDVNPQAPTHILAIPRHHYVDVADISAADPALLSAVVAELCAAAEDLGVNEGYRVVFNKGAEGGQTVPHVHAHLLAGRQLTWPPG